MVASLRTGEAPPLLLAAGPSEYWRDRVVEGYREGARAAGAEFARLEGDELDAESLEGALESLSLFASSRRLWIREGGKLAKACEERLLAWADAPPEGLSILFTTARMPDELKFLGSLAVKSAFVACEERPGDLPREAARLAEEARLRCPPGLLEALAARAGALLSLRHEIEKLALLADAAGRVPPSAAEVIAGGRGAASADRWAAAVLRRDGAAARAEAAALAAEGTSVGNALWAVASIALAALEPPMGGYGYRRAPAGPALSPPAARAALDAVHRADRAMKRGEIRDAQLLDVLERDLIAPTPGGSLVRNA
jgi:DNA polymerase III delta subunit